MPKWTCTDGLAGGINLIKTSLKVKGITTIFNLM